MLTAPKPGRRVELRYRPALRAVTGLHAARGVVLAVGRGPGPRNHLVAIDGGRRVVVPRGHVFAVAVARRGELHG